jgi:hypothetical protein
MMAVLMPWLSDMNIEVRGALAAGEKVTLA